MAEIKASDGLDVRFGLRALIGYLQKAERDYGDLDVYLLDEQVTGIRLEETIGIGDGAVYKRIVRLH